MIQWIHQSGGVLDRVFCIEQEDYRLSELGSLVFRSKSTELRNKLGGTCKREISCLQKKDVLVNNFGTTEQIQLILVPLDQQLAELTNRNKSSELGSLIFRSKRTELRKKLGGT